MDPEDSTYVFTLSEYSLEKAKRELKEDPKQRLGAIQTLRQWIREQPHYVCRTDTAFILSILRKAKFSQLAARELIDNILTMRTKYPEFMVNLDLQDPSVLAYIERGIFIPLPKRDKEGRAIWLMRGGLIDLNDPKFSPTNEVRCALALSELARLNDESAVVDGVVYISDFTGIGMKHLTRTSMEHNKKQMKIYQDANPERFKMLLLYNAGAVVEFVMTVFKPLMKKKFQERISAHETLESMYKIIPMEHWPDEYLPDDYTGPSAGSIKDIIATWMQLVRDPANRQKVLEFTHERYKVDESKRPASGQIPRQESFRKLNTD